MASSDHLRQRQIGVAETTDSRDVENGDAVAHGHGTSEKKVHRRLPMGIQPAGESNRKFFHPIKFFVICFKGSHGVAKFVNLLWPFVPAAIAVYCALDKTNPVNYKLIFALNYVAMIPAANMVGFAGQSLAKKLPLVFGVVLETFLGGIVEIILLVVLLTNEKGLFRIIKDAILGSILANLLFCLGACFFMGGLGRKSQHFDKAISEVGSGLLLTAGVGLTIPCAFFFALGGVLNDQGTATDERTEGLILQISRATAVILLLAFVIYVWFQMRTHHGLYSQVLENDEANDEDREKELKRPKLTLTETVIAMTISLACVTVHAIFLVNSIDPIVTEPNSTVSDLFMGLILVPLVEKFAEHLTAIDEAWDNQINFALAHVLGSTLQTALLNAPLVVIIAWGLPTSKDLDLNFPAFEAILLILAILVVGNFIRDQESNYLEGALCILIYVIIAVAAYYYRPIEEGGGESEGSGSEAGGGEGSSGMNETAAEHAVLVARYLSSKLS